MSADIQALYERYRSGDKSVRDELILACLPAIKAQCRSFVKANEEAKSLSDDIVSEATVESVITIDRRNEGTLEKLLSTAVRRKCWEVLNCRSIVGPTDSTVVHKLGLLSAAQSELDELPTLSDMTAAQQERASQLGHIIQELQAELSMFAAPSVELMEHDKTCGDFFSAFELKDQIDSCCQDEIDKQIVELRIEGFNDAEIGEKLGKDQSTIMRRRAKLEERFDASCLALGA